MLSRTLAFLVFASLALAGSGQLAPPDVLGNVLDVVRADWNSDGQLDRAVLWQPQQGEDLANLYVFLSGSNEPLVVAGVAWSRFGGQEAWLKRTRAASAFSPAEPPVTSTGRKSWRLLLTRAARGWSATATKAKELAILNTASSAPPTSPPARAAATAPSLPLLAAHRGWPAGASSGFRRPAGPVDPSGACWSELFYP